MKYYFPVHLNGGNRGCEGIAKGTSMILGEDSRNLIGLSTDTDLDRKLGINNYVTLYPSRKPTLFDNFKFHVYHRIMSADKLKQYIYSYWYDSFLNEINSNDIMLITGGDMLCYDDNYVNYITSKLHDRGIKTVLWGCSMGPENLTTEKEKTLRCFNMVYTRDTLTKEFFNNLGLDNVVCCADPAFLLKPEKTHLPFVFEKGDVIGINLSNFVLGDYTLNSSFGQHVKQLIDFILKETDLQILLIPHVTWPNQDDRAVVNNIKQQYISNERVATLDIDILNYCKIRYVISKCRFFIGARTHAIISAYSTCVPSIALGYSIKSKGIAKDLGLDEKTVVNYKVKNAFDELRKSVQYIFDNEALVREHMRMVLPQYSSKPYGMREIIRELK